MSIRFLLDTNVVSEPTKPRPDARVTAWMDQWPPEHLALSVITFGEIQEGIGKLDAGAKRAALTRWIEQELPERFGARVLPVDVLVAREWGRIAAEGRRTGRTLPDADGLLLATAAFYELELVTRNERNFRDRGVLIHNPWKP